MVQKMLRVLQLVPKANRRRLASRQIGGGLKAHSYSDTLPPTRPHLLIVLLPEPSIYISPHCESLFLAFF